MRMYKLALFFAIIGAMSGMLNCIMVDSGGNNWFDRSIPDMQVIELDEDNVEILQFDSETGILEEAASLPKYFNIMISVLQGTFLIVTMLDDYLIFDVGGTNLFAPVLYFFQAIIWFVYIIGGVQFILGRSMKVME